MRGELGGYILFSKAVADYGYGYTCLDIGVIIEWWIARHVLAFDYDAFWKLLELLELSWVDRKMTQASTMPGIVSFVIRTEKCSIEKKLKVLW